MRIVRLPGVFKPPSDTRLLAWHMLREPLPAGAQVLDLCTGSGFLAVTAALVKRADAVAVDVSRRAVFTARLNGRLNGVSVRAVRGDLFAPVAREQFDLIVSNPPYLPDPSAHLPTRGRARAWQANRSGRAFLDRICDEADAHLKPGGTLLLVHSSVCGEEATLSALAAKGLETVVVGRHRGPLGPLLAARSSWLRAQGMLDQDGLEEMLVIRAQRPQG